MYPSTVKKVIVCLSYFFIPMLCLGTEGVKATENREPTPHTLNTYSDGHPNAYLYIDDEITVEYSGSDSSMDIRFFKEEPLKEETASRIFVIHTSCYDFTWKNDFPATGFYIAPYSYSKDGYQESASRKKFWGGFEFIYSQEESGIKFHYHKGWFGRQELIPITLITESVIRDKDGSRNNFKFYREKKASTQGQRIRVWEVNYSESKIILSWKIKESDVEKLQYPSKNWGLFSILSYKDSTQSRDNMPYIKLHYHVIGYLLLFIVYCLYYKVVNKSIKKFFNNYIKARFRRKDNC